MNKCFEEEEEEEPNNTFQIRFFFFGNCSWTAQPSVSFVPSQQERDR